MFEGRLAFVEKFDEALVLRGESFRGVEQKKGHVGLGGALQGGVHGKAFHRVGDARTPANAGGIYEGVGFAVLFHRYVHAVARGARLIAHDHAVFSDEGVGHGRLARVGAAQQAQPEVIGNLAAAYPGSVAVFFQVFLFFAFFLVVEIVVFGEKIADFFFKGAQVVPVFGGAGDEGKAQTVEFRKQQLFLFRAVHLVHHQQYGLVAFAQVCGEVLVEGHETVLSVHHHADDVGFLQGGFGLAQNIGFETAYARGAFGHGLMMIERDAARVDDGEIAAVARTHHAFHTVARDAGAVMRDGAVAADKAVEQGGLAHIGASQQNDFGHHGRAPRYVLVWIVVFRRAGSADGLHPAQALFRNVCRTQKERFGEDSGRRNMLPVGKNGGNLLRPRAASVQPFSGYPPRREKSKMGRYAI